MQILGCIVHVCVIELVSRRYKNVLRLFTIHLRAKLTHKQSPKWCAHTYLCAIFVAVATVTAVAFAAFVAAIGINIHILLVGFTFLNEIPVFFSVFVVELKNSAHQSLQRFFASPMFEGNKFASTFSNSIADWIHSDATIKLKSLRHHFDYKQTIRSDRTIYRKFRTSWPSILFAFFAKFRRRRFIGRSSSIHNKPSNLIPNYLYGIAAFYWANRSVHWKFVEIIISYTNFPVR